MKDIKVMKDDASAVEKERASRSRPSYVQYFKV